LRSTEPERKEQEVADGAPARSEQDYAEAECGGDVDKLIHLAEKREKQLRQWLSTKRRRLSLNSERRRFKHPVTIYHLEQVASHIHSILFLLKPPNDKLANDQPGRASLRSLLNQLEAPSQLSRESAWELAGEFERQLIELGNDAYLYTLLKDQVGSDNEDERSEIKRVPSIANWKEHFSEDDLKLLCDEYEHFHNFDGGRTRREVRYALRHLHLVRSEEHRRDRARISLRARYFGRLTLLLTGLLIVLCYCYLRVTVPELDGIKYDTGLPAFQQDWPYPLFLLLFVFFSGALGDVVSRAYRLGRQSLRVETVPRADEAPLGIRMLLSQGKSLFAQVALGGTAAVIIYIVLQLISPDFEPIAYGVIGFLVGYSEAFFSKMLQETTGMGQTYSGL
jgi:hypothetical protein